MRIREVVILTELFDKPYQWLKLSNEHYEFYTDQDLGFEVSLTPMNKNTWELEFVDDDENLGLTGVVGFEAIRVLSTVWACLKDFVKTVRPDRIYFEADKKPGSKRSDIYTRIIKKYPIPNYDWTVRDYGHVTIYYLHHSTDNKG